MDERTPLDDKILKTILPYMEANLRLHLSQKYPSIKAIDQFIPLRIDNLEFGPYKLVINNTEYSLGVYRDYPLCSAIPKCVVEENANGGIPYNVDEFGFEVKMDETVVSASDIPWDFWAPNHEPPEKYVDARLADLEELLKTTKDERYKEHLKEQKEKLEVWKVSYDARLYDLESETQGALPYKFLLQFIKKTPKTTHVELGLYNMKLHEAFKILTTKFFGNRKAPIIVERFKVHEGTRLISLPWNMQFVVRGIESYGDPLRTFRRLHRIVDGSSYPLEYLELRNVDVATFSRDTLTRISDNTEKLIISGYVRNFIDMAELCRLRIKVVVKTADTKYYGHNFVMLVKKWMNDKTPIGTIFTFEMSPANRTKIMGLIREDLAEEGDTLENGDFVVFTDEGGCIEVRDEPDKCALVVEVMEDVVVDD
ncbi:unnamed protein product [Caenorhabditis brenneri]